jgi:predicted dienelactone hydrolase
MRPAPIVDFWLPGGAADRLQTEAQPANPQGGAAKVKFPLLLYCPGWAATAIDNAALLARLSDAGFAVAAVHYPAARPGLSSRTVFRQREEFEMPMDFSSARGFANTIERSERRVRNRAADARDILDAIISGTLEGAGRGVLDRVDAARVAIFGFSLGGAVAAEVCVSDRRFLAAVNLDGWHFGEALERGVPRPYLFISDDSPPPTARDLSSIRPNRRYPAMLDHKNQDRLTHNLAHHGGHLLMIAGTRHTDFADQQPRLGRREWLRRRAITPARVLDIVFGCTRAFFVQYLVAGQASLLQQVAAGYPEARLRSWPRPAKSGADLRCLSALPVPIRLPHSPRRQQ